MKNILMIFILICIVTVAVWLIPDLRNQANRLLKETGLKWPSATMYKWRNQDGVMQYTQTLPPEGVPYEEVEARSDVNVLPLPEKLKE